MNIHDLPEKLIGRIFPEPNTGCWLWGGPVNAKGYGMHSYRRDGKWTVTTAHRAVYGMLRGIVPRNLVTDHLCRVRSCVNPDHIRVVTDRENVLFNSVGKAAQNHAKSCCPKCSREYTAESRMRGGKQSQHRRCRPCNAERTLEQYYAKKANA